MNLFSDKVLRVLAVAISAWVVGASVYLCAVSPARPWTYLLAPAVIALAWTARQLRAGPADQQAFQADRRQATLAIVLAGSLLGLALIVPLGWSGGQFAARSSGVMMGVIVIAFANVIPKRAGSARALALRRIAGWSLVLGGLGYALAWLLLPLGVANLAATAALFLGLSYAIVRIGWSRLTQRPSTPARPG